MTSAPLSAAAMTSAALFPKDYTGTAGQVGKAAQPPYDGMRALIAGGGGDGSGKTSALSMSIGAWALPHPEKLKRGGEDAHFVGREAAGVADGVGGWAQLGVDPGVYSREFMKGTETAITDIADMNPDDKPLAVLRQAHAHANRAGRGSTTACFAYLDAGGSSLKVANLGDSALFLIRRGKIAFKTPTQQHEFNFPYQIGSDASDTAEMADIYDIAVSQGDILVLGTDGLMDNVFDDDIVSIVWEAASEGRSPDEISQMLTLHAKSESMSETGETPFSRHAQEAGRKFPGGKPDDITVVVCFCLPAQTVQDSAPPERPPDEPIPRF